jgi:hypothetical protein
LETAKNTQRKESTSVYFYLHNVSLTPPHPYFFLSVTEWFKNTKGIPPLQADIGDSENVWLSLQTQNSETSLNERLFACVCT